MDLNTILLPVILTAAVAGLLAGVVAFARCRNDEKPQGRRAALLLIVVALGLGGAVLCQLGPVALTEFTSKEGGFSVLLPGTPDPVAGRVKAFRCESRLRGYTLIVGYGDLTDADRKGKTGQELARQACESQKDQWNRPLLESRALTLPGGFPGHEARLETASGAVVHVRVYLVEQRLFQLMAVVEKRNEDLVPAFFDSFKLTGP